MNSEKHSEEYGELARLQTDSIKERYASNNPDMLNTAQKALLAIAFSLDKDFDRANALLENAHTTGDNDHSCALYMEAELLISSERQSNWVALQEKAKEVVRLNPDAIFANRTLSMFHFQLNDHEEGKRILLQLIGKYPASNFLYLDLIRALMSGKIYKEARDYISSIEDTPRRSLYWLYLRVIQPFRILLIITIFSLFMLPATALPAFIIVSSLGLLLLITSHLLHEKQLFAHSVGILVFVILIFLMGQR